MDQTFRKIIKFSLPMTLLGAMELFLVTIDYFWIYLRIGEPEALSAVRISVAMIALVESVLVAVLSSLLVYVSQHIGAKKDEEVKRGVRGTFSFVIYSGLLTMVIGILCVPFLKSLFGVNHTISSYVDQYFKTYLYGYLFIALNTFLLLVPRYLQKLKLIYEGMAISVVVNFIATPFVMLWFDQLGWPQIAGAAIGTIAANFICCVYLFRCIFVKDRLGMGVTWKELSLKLDYLLLKQNGAYIGTQIFQAITYNLSMFLYILILSYYPSDVFNVFSVANYIFVFFGLFPQYFALSLIPIVSQYVGARQIAEVKDIARKMVMILYGYGAIVAAIILFNRHSIASALATNPHLEQLISQFLLIYTLPWILSMVSFVYIFVVAGSGDVKGGYLLTILNMYVVVLASLLWMPHFFHNTARGVFLTLGFISVATFIISIVYYLTGRWEKASLVKKEDSKQVNEASSEGM